MIEYTNKQTVPTKIMVETIRPATVQIPHAYQSINKNKRIMAIPRITKISKVKIVMVL